jgi:hypothetical protein
VDEIQTIEAQEFKDYIQSRQLPRQDTRVVLKAMDGTTVETYVHGLRQVRTLRSDNKVMVQRCAEYGAEFIEWLAGELRYRRSKGFDNIVMVTGPERSGKSTFTQRLARTLDPNISLDHITFKIRDFNHAIEIAPEGAIVIMDEAGIDMYSQEWWDEFQIQLVKKLFVIGVKHLTLILVIPHRLDLNKKIRDRRVQYWVNVSHMKRTLERGYATIREACTSEWTQDIYWDTLGMCRFGPLSGPEWDEYEKKKLAFVDEINSGEYGTRESKSVNKQRDDAILYCSELGASQTKIGERLGLAQSTINKIIKNAKTKEQQTTS